jgi:fructokinase
VIVIAGEALIDLVVMDGAVLPSPGGGPCNTARALGRLGASVGFFGRLSRDLFGSMLADALVSSGVRLDYTTRGPEPSPLAIANRAAGGEVEYSFYLAGTTLTAVEDEGPPAPGADVRALHIGSLALALEPSATVLEALIERERGRRIVVIDPNVRPAAIADATDYRARFDRCCRAAHIIKLSASDASWLYPGIGPELVAERLLDLGAELVVITLGADGALACTPNGSGRAPSPRVDVADTIGAGDAFGAGLLFALEECGSLVEGGAAALPSSELNDVLRFSSAVAALTCARAGADTPTRAEVDRVLTAGP